VSGWEQRARAMARQIAYLPSRWMRPGEVGSREGEDGPSDEAAWLGSGYDRHRTLVTRAGTVHAGPGTDCDGRATSSATLPGLVIGMFRHARIYGCAGVLDVGTGSGYGAALVTRRLGADHVTSIKIDPYVTADATGDLPGAFNRIVPMVPLPVIPAAQPGHDA
jgi:hypothetical protein